MISPPLSFTSKQALSNWCRQMLIDDRPPLLRYAISLASVATALSVASLLPYRADPSHFTLFFVAVMVSAWYGGLGAGLLATILSALSLDYFFIAPIHSITLDWRALLRLSTFVLVSLVTSSLTAARKRAEEALRQAHAELETESGNGPPSWPKPMNHCGRKLASASGQRRNSGVFRRRWDEWSVWPRWDE